MLPLDNALFLTSGNPLGWTALLQNLHPAYGSYTGVSHPAGSPVPLIGQIRCRLGERLARVSYLLPAEHLAGLAPLGLLEELAFQAGEWGACHLLAEIEEHAPALESFRRAGFAVYTWQRIWRVNTTPQNDPAKFSLWEAADPVGDTAIRALYQSLVPPLVQSAESLSSARLQGIVYRQGDEFLGYVDVTQGRRGIFLVPLIHPTVDNIAQLLSDLFRRLAPRPDRPLYLAVRSYQSWLETALADLGAEAGPRQALLVKHLAVMQRALASNARRAVIENVKAEPTAPISHFLLQLMLWQSEYPRPAFPPAFRAPSESIPARSGKSKRETGFATRCPIDSRKVTSQWSGKENGIARIG